MIEYTRIEWSETLTAWIIVPTRRNVRGLPSHTQQFTKRANERANARYMPKRKRVRKAIHPKG